MKAFVLCVVVLLVGCGGSVQSKPAPPPTAQAKIVAFYGDSLTANWNLAKSFPGDPYMNEGTGGRTAVMLTDSFDATVPPTKPNAVMILAGTNDVFGGDTADHIFSVLTVMYGKSKTDGIPFAICTVPPMRTTDAFHNPVIVDLDNQLRAYAVANKIPLADYYSALVDPASGELRTDFTKVLDGTNGQLDTVHINDAGYAAITPLAAKAISELPAN